MGLQGQPPLIAVRRSFDKELAFSYLDIVAALKDLAVNPRPYGYKKLKGRPGYRIRVGDYRIIYQVKNNILTVYILIIGHRREVYD
jgi:mRNA interferase RelE/StbE